MSITLPPALAKALGSDPSTAVESALRSLHQRLQGPEAIELRAVLDDDTIGDVDVIGDSPTAVLRHVLRWVVGDVPHLLKAPDAG